MDEKTSHPPDGQRLRSIEQQLIAANQQLEAGNQQLRASEKQLREERKRAQQYFNVAWTIMVVIAPDQKVTLVNKKGCEVLGCKQDEVLGRNWFDAFLPESVLEKTKATFQQLIDGQAELIEYNENLVLTKSGEERIIDWHNAAITDEDDNVVEVLASGVDVTERKRAEEKLVRLNKVLKTVTSINQDMFLIKDRRELLERICERIVEYAYTLVWIGSCDERTKEVVPEAQAGFEKGYLDSVKITYDDTDYGKGPTGTAIRTKKPNVMRFIATDPRYEPWRKEALKRGYRSSTAIPIFRGEEVIGALNVYADKEDAFGNEEVNLLEKLGHNISTGLRGIDEEIRRKEAEEALQAANQQLRASEQQLKAANQQLQASEQQLRAANQQLDATNQQLRASEQQLKAANQQLEAGNQQLRASEKQLREERKRAQQYFNVAGTIMVVIAPDQKVTLVNKKGCEVLGCKQDEVLGRNWFDAFLPESVREKTKATFQQLIDGHTELIEYNENLVLTKSGEERIIDWHNAAITDEDGNVVEVLASGVDVTERKLAEEAVARSERIYRRTIENAQGVPYQLRFSDGQYVFMGSGVEELVGIPAEKLTQERFTEMARETVIADLRGYDNPDAYCEAFGMGGFDRFQADVRICTPKGQTKWFSDCSLLIRDEKTGEVTGCIGVLQDITLRKLAEEERKALIVDLEVKNAELERFTYTISHDLKSPLITIKGFLGLLEQDMSEGNVERIKGDIKRIGGAAEKMHRRLDELLELSRVGRLVSPPEEVSLRDLAREAVDLVAGQTAERGVQIGISPEMPVIFGDHPRLLEVLQNLIDNAVKFMGDEPNPCIEIGVRKDDDETVCYVKDNGMGIDPSYHEKVFGLFEKLGHESEGTGVGLALVKRIIEVHGGRIWVESEGSGKGSTFCFTIP